MSAIKICGLTTPGDAVAAAEAGADLLGFVFHEPSPRSVSSDRAAELIRQVRGSGFSPRCIGVFVDCSVDWIRRVADTAGLNGVQLHGEEAPEDVDRLGRDGLFVIKAFRIGHQREVEGIAGYSASAYLLDTYVPGRHGGTGRLFDWSLAVRVAKERPILLAGGLTPENVASAICAVRPWGVDVSSGVESAPGRKDRDKVRRFIAVARAAMGRR